MIKDAMKYLQPSRACQWLVFAARECVSHDGADTTTEHHWNTEQYAKFLYEDALEAVFPIVKQPEEARELLLLPPQYSVDLILCDYQKLGVTDLLNHSGPWTGCFKYALIERGLSPMRELMEEFLQNRKNTENTAL